MITHRRAFLHGLGATLALPWLESFAPIARAASVPEGVRQIVTGPPRRWATILFANGVNAREWWAREEAGQIAFSDTLQPLAPHQEDLLVLNKLEYFGGTSGAHWPQFTNFLSGAKLRQTTIPDAAESIDQIMAQAVGRETFLPSMHLGVEPVEPGLRLGVPAIYYSTVSWSSRNTPIPPEIYPRAAFDRLFDKESLLQDRSVLDLVLQQSKRLRTRLDAHDRAKLEQYMDNVRNLEQRIERATAEKRLEGWQPTLATPDLPRPEEGTPHDFADHTRMMFDLMVLAFQMDKTRVLTFIMDKDVSNQKFDFIDGVGGAQMHGISHHKDNPKTLAEYQKINRWHVEQFAYLLERMKAVDEGNGTLLDNSMLLFGSNMMDGNIHDGRELPLVLAGGRNCGIAPGRVLTYEQQEQRELCNLHLALAQRMGVEIDQFGDSTMALPNLG